MIRGLKARSKDNGAGLQPLMLSDINPGALPQAGMERALALDVGAIVRRLSVSIGAYRP